MDSTAIFKLSYGLFVIGTSFDGKDNGCIVNTVMQVTSQPMKVSTVVATRISAMGSSLSAIRPQYSMMPTVGATNNTGRMEARKWPVSLICSSFTMPRHNAPNSSKSP